MPRHLPSQFSFLLSSLLCTDTCLFDVFHRQHPITSLHRKKYALCFHGAITPPLPTCAAYRDYKKATAIPKDLAQRMARHGTEAYAAW